MKKRRLMAAALCAVLAASTALSGCGGNKAAGNGSQAAGNETGKAESGTSAVYTKLYGSEATTLNYLTASSENDNKIGANCVDTLIEYDNKGQIKPGLSTEWSYDDATLTWTFKLREAKWVDNTGAEVADVTAQDFVDAMKYELTPEYESANVQNLFGVIANVEKYYMEWYITAEQIRTERYGSRLIIQK